MLLVAAPVSACVPLLTVTQPATDMLISDGDGQPLAGATVHFARQLFGPNGHAERLRFTSDHAGSIRLDRESYLQTALLAVDGVAIYGWSYCIEKPGFVGVARNQLSKNTSKRPRWKYRCTARTYQAPARSTRCPGVTMSA